MYSKLSGLTKIVRLLVVLLVAGLAALPQYSPRAVSGVVTDKRGNALPGSAVQLENPVNQSVVSYITGKDGVYHFDGLRDDIDYTVRAKYRKYWSERKTLSKFKSAKHLKVNLVIPIE